MKDGDHARVVRPREFYEFVLPPVDIIREDGAVLVIVDIPGFKREEIRLTLYDTILRIKAKKADPPEEKAVSLQRPKMLEKKIRLPPDSAGSVDFAVLEDGVLRVRIVPRGKREAPQNMPAAG